jgi:CubicO group peptidase (beta-lactamase class C family)
MVNNMPRILLAVGLVLALGATAFAQTPNVIPTETLAEKVDQLFAQWDKPDAPGCALAVIKDGRIIYQRGYGTANLELSVPITDGSVFNVGSVAKQFTAASILMLTQQGKLSLDDDVRKYVSEVPDFGIPITIRQLIHHTSGLRDHLEMLEMSGWRNDDVHTEKDVLDMVSRQRTLNFKPGDEYSYSNTGYVLLALVVKRVTGQSLSEFAEANIFKPLGMTNTRFYDDHRTIIKGLANGYLPKEGGGFLKWMPADDFLGSGNLFTTVENLARWDKNFYDRKVGGDALFEQMLAPGVLNDGEKIEYGFGLLSGQYKGLRTVYHNGARLGYRAELVRFPERRFSVACLCNTRAINPDALARRVADIYLADHFKPAAGNPNNPNTVEPKVVSISEKELSGVAGLYWNPVTDNVRRVYVKGDKLMFARLPGSESVLAPLGSNRFQMLGVRNNIEIVFKSPRPGAPFQMFLTVDGGKPSLHEPVKSASYKPQRLIEFAGEYHSSEINATYTIAAQGDKLLLRTGNWGDFSLSARFHDSFANPEEIGSIMFKRDRRNKVSGFVIRSGKVKNLRFDKVD